MKFIILLFFIFNSSFSFAGGNSSAGGDGAVIGKKIYLLDFVESGVHEAPYFQNPNYFHENVAQQISNHIDISLAVAKLVSAKLIEVYAKNPLFEYFLKKKIFQFEWSIVPLEFEDVPDDGFENLVQLAIRQSSRVLISKIHWDKMDNKNKAGLIFHEMIYALTDHFNQHQSHSSSARLITGKIFHQKFEQLSGKRFLSVLNRYGMKFYGIISVPNIVDNQLVVLKEHNFYSLLSGKELLVVKFYLPARSDLFIEFGVYDAKFNADASIEHVGWGLYHALSGCSYSTCHFLDGGLWTNREEFESFFQAIQKNQHSKYKIYQSDDLFL